MADISKSHIDILKEDAANKIRWAAAAYRHLGCALALQDVTASIEAYEESLRLQPGQGDVIVRLHGLYEQQNEERYGGGKDNKAVWLRALVRQALANAKENGCSFQGCDDEFIADDLLLYDADLESEDRGAVIQAVAAVRKESA